MCGSHWSQVLSFAMLHGTSPWTSTAAYWSIASHVNARTSWNEEAYHFCQFDHESKWIVRSRPSWPSELWKTSGMCLPHQGRPQAVEVAVQQQKPRQARGHWMVKVNQFRAQRKPRTVREVERKAHEAAGHTPYLDWCAHCVAGTGRGDQHLQTRNVNLRAVGDRCRLRRTE